MMPLLVLLIAYLLGAIPFGYLLVKWTTGSDVRASGSGNIGATNVLRTTGRAAGVATLLLDIAKGYLAVWIAGRLTGSDPIWMSAAALVVMAGHAYPVFLRFQGGKAVASFIGAFLCLTPGAMVCRGGRVDASHFPWFHQRGRDISTSRVDRGAPAIPGFPGGSAGWRVHRVSASGKYRQAPRRH